MDLKRMSLRSPRAALEPQNVPVPRRSRGSRNPFVIIGSLLLTILFLTTVAAGVMFVVGKERFEMAGPLKAEKIVNIPRGGVRDTAELLAKEGVIEQPWLFTAAAVLLKTRDDLKYGEYQFARSASIRDVLDTIMDGKVVQHSFTVAEGLTSEQVVQRLLENPVLAGSIREFPREGTLLPDTYRFTRGMTREQIVKRMQDSQKKILQEVWDRRPADLPIKTPEQLVTLASIIEKETGKVEERTRVAAVFVNRLKQRMKLQSDPTIIYGLVGGRGALGRPIMRAEIDQPTPYNTYVIDGLPPGPIANPGRAALEAAVSPARTRELFFVADGTGGHAFSESYGDHQKHVARLRQIEQQANQALTPAALVTPPPPAGAFPAPAASSSRPAPRPAQPANRTGGAANAAAPAVPAPAAR